MGEYQQTDTVSSIWIHSHANSGQIVRNLAKVGIGIDKLDIC